MGILHKWPLRLFCFATILFFELPLSFGSSINVPLHDWSYDALLHLSANGLIDAHLNTRPLTRKEVAALTAIAITSLDKATYSDLLLIKRLAREFESELSNLDIKVPTEVKSRLSEKREKTLFLNSLKGSVFYYNADIFEHCRHFNVDYQKGLTYEVDFELAKELANILWLNISGDVRWDEKQNQLELSKAYIIFRFFGIDLQVGRDSLWWGPGYHGALIVSDNPPPFDMVKISKEFKRTKVVNFLTILGKNRKIPRPLLHGLRVEWIPIRGINLGATLVSMFGRDGKASWDDVKELFDLKTNSPTINRLASIDVAYNQIKGVTIYGVTAGDDWNYGSIFPRRIIPWGRLVAHTLGVYLSDPIKTGRTNFRVEWTRLNAHPNAEWYNHAYYRTGYKYKGYVIGHHLGLDSEGKFLKGDAEDLFFQVNHWFSEHIMLSIKYEKEKRWLSSRPTEHRDSIGFELFFDPRQDLRISLMYRFATIFNKGNKEHPVNGIVYSKDSPGDVTFRLELCYRF